MESALYGVYTLVVLYQKSHSFASLTCSISDTPQLVCKHHTRTLSMKNSIYMLNDNDPACQALTSFCSSFNLLQLVTHPTRITETSETLFDVLLATNRNLVMEMKVVPLSMSDHDLICATLKL